MPTHRRAGRLPTAGPRHPRLRCAAPRHAARETLARGATCGRARRGRVDEATFDELEEALILADVGLPTTDRLLDARSAPRRRGNDPRRAHEALRSEIVALFDGDETDLASATRRRRVWLFVGVNGVGKTTTIGKLARREPTAAGRVVLAAGDTFRAAAGEQLERLGGARRRRDRAGRGRRRSVLGDLRRDPARRGARRRPRARRHRRPAAHQGQPDGRAARRSAGSPTGRPGTSPRCCSCSTRRPARTASSRPAQFTEAVGVTGIVLTKLDGTAKGGIVLAIRSELGLPIKLVGLGEGWHDLVDLRPRGVRRGAARLSVALDRRGVPTAGRSRTRGERPTCSPVTCGTSRCSTP